MCAIGQTTHASLGKIDPTTRSDGCCPHGIRQLLRGRLRIIYLENSFS
jgi:hypothetical protein